MARFTWAALALVLAASAAQAESFDNRAVIALSQAGIGEDVLLAKVASLPCSYDVGTDALIALRGAGVPSPVIAAMVDRCTGAARAQGAGGSASDPAVHRKPGLYIDLGEGGAHALRIIRPTTGMSGKITGNGSILFPFSAKLGLPNPAAQMRAGGSQPAFYFYFETDDAQVGDFGTSGTISAQSPSEFTLVRFKVKDGQREMSVGKSNMFNTRLGINPKDALPTAIEEIGDGIFKVVPASPLPAGEYGFVLRAGAETYRVYDFRVG